jgi:hypothetical protein
VRRDSNRRPGVRPDDSSWRTGGMSIVAVTQRRPTRSPATNATPAATPIDGQGFS